MRGETMDNIAVVNYGSTVGGLILVGAVAIAMWRFSPPPWRNTIFAAFALGMFALGTVRTLDVSVGSEGMKMKIAELEKTNAGLSTKIAGMEKNIIDQKQLIASLGTRDLS